MLVFSSAGPESTAYSFRPGSPDAATTVLEPQSTTQHPDAVALLPVNYWNNGEFEDQLDPQTMTYTTLSQMFANDVSTAKSKEYVSLDGSVFLPAGRVFQQVWPPIRLDGASLTISTPVALSPRKQANGSTSAANRKIVPTALRLTQTAR